MSKSSSIQMYLTPEQLRIRWGYAYSAQTLINWRNLKKGPPFVRHGNRVLYPIASVEKWEREHFTPSNDNESEGK